MGVKLGQKWAVKDGNLLASNQVGSRFFNKEFDFSRTTSGTYIDRDGLLKTAELYNKIPYSEDFSQWTKSVSGITLEGGYTSPDGNNNAYKMTVPSNGAYIYQSITLSNEGTTSVYVKSDNLTGEFYLVTADGGLIAQTVTSEWTRVSLTSTPSSSTFRVWLRLENAGDSIYIYGAQLVEGTEPRDYQYTNGRIGIPRIDFSDGVGSLLLEAQRSNLLLQSNSFDTTWTKFGSTTIVSGQSGIYGSNDAWLYTNGGGGYIYQSHTTSVGTYSVYGKKGDNGSGNILYLFADGVGGRYFDLENGTLSTEILTGLTDSKIESVGGGWYRCSITFPNSTRVRIYAGESTSTDTIYIQHAQLEEGSYSTSIIETTTSQVTRTADVANNCGTEQDFNSEEGVLYAEIKEFENTSSDYKYISISDGTYNNRLSILYSIGGTNQIRVFYRVGGVAQCDLFDDLPSSTEYAKIAFKYKENDFALWINGVEVSTDLSGSVLSPNTLNNLSFSEIGTSSSPFKGKVRSVKYFPTALTDDELQNLTT